MIGTGIGLGLSGFRLKSGPSTIPESIPGLQLWLDAADSNTLLQTSGGSLAAVDGDPVGQWLDKSGNGRHAVQASGTSKPALKTGVKNGLNGVLFDGVNDWLTSPAFSITGTNRWLFLVFNLASTAKNILNHGLADSTENYLVQFGTNSFYVDVGGNGPYVDVTTTTSAGFKILGSVWTRPAGSSMDLFLNGSITQPAVSNAATSPNQNSVVMDIGRGRNGGSYFDSHILEVVYGSGTLTTQDRNKLTGYLNDKWGVY